MSTLSSLHAIEPTDADALHKVGRQTLAILRRGTRSIRLGWSSRVQATAPPPDDAEEGVVRHSLSFWQTGDAERYLRSWRGDVVAMHQLRGVLARTQGRRHLLSWSDDQVLRALAAQLASGMLSATEARADATPARTIELPIVLAAAAAPTAPVAVPHTEPVMRPSAISALPLLPILEEVQIEGAEVLPEILQSLAQVALTLDNIDLASVSLEPTPSGVPAIATAIGDAGSGIAAALAAL